MPGSRPTDTGRRACALIGVIALIVLFITPVSATVLYDEVLEVYEFTGGKSTFSLISSTPAGSQPLNKLVFKQIQDCNDISYIVIESPHSRGNPDWCLLAEGNHPLEYTLDSHTGTGTINVYKSKNVLGQITNTRITLYFDNWDIGEAIGEKTVSFAPTLGSIQTLSGGSTQSESGNSPVTLSNRWLEFPYTITASCGRHFYNTLAIEDFDYGNSIRLIVNREYGSKFYASNVTVYDNENQVIYNDQSRTNLNQVFLASSVGSVMVQTAYNTWEYPLSTTSPSTSPPVTVYVRNSQTGALLADAHIEIQDTTTDPWTEVVNQTLPSGHGTFSLAKDPGLHLTQYRIGATVPGYQQVVPALFFRVTGPTNVVVEMEPIEGGPVNEDNAYLEFYVRDLNANGIPNANVLVDGQLRWTNAQGYTQIEVAKNASYPYSVSKSGYVTIEGRATVADGPRYVVNVVQIGRASCRERV